MISILTLNCNGLRSAIQKNLLEWLKVENPDIVCLQEIKIHQRDLTESLQNLLGYQTYYYPAEKAGYSGVAVWAKTKPLSFQVGMDIAEYDREARILRLEWEKFSVASVYFPSGTSGEHRQTVKERFLNDFLSFTEKINKKVIFSGDFNIAHTEQDIHHPERHHKQSGFLPHERKWFSELLEKGYTDSFRFLYPAAKEYSWYNFRSNARSKNLGWRIDYHIVSDDLADKIQEVKIYQDVVFSDHCPVMLRLKDV